MSSTISTILTPGTSAFFTPTFLFTVACEAVFFSGRFYLLHDEKTVLGKLLPVIFLQLFLSYQRNFIYMLEFLLYLFGDYFLFYVHDLKSDNEKECLLFGILTFLIGHIIGIFTLDLSTFISIEKPLWFSFLWLVAGFLAGFIINKFDNYLIGIIISQYVIVITFRLSLCLMLNSIEGLSLSLFCLSDILILVSLFAHNNNNKVVSNGILIFYWISLVLHIIHTL